MQSSSHTNGIYPEKTIMHPVFITALITIARTWKQLKCPSTEEWIKQAWYIYTMKYYSAIKKNEIFVEMWIDLESEEKNKYHILTTYVWNLKNWYRQSYLQSRNRDTVLENKCMDTTGDRSSWMNSEIGVYIYTLLT